LTIQFGLGTLQHALDFRRLGYGASPSSEEEGLPFVSAGRAHDQSGAITGALGVEDTVAKGSGQKRHQHGDPYPKTDSEADHADTAYRLYANTPWLGQNLHPAFHSRRVDPTLPSCWIWSLSPSRSI
jgi:hypothetical protein